MKCNYCKSEVQETESTCPFCGTPVGANSPVDGRILVSEKAEEPFSKDGKTREETGASGADPGFEAGTEVFGADPVSGKGTLAPGAGASGAAWTAGTSVGFGEGAAASGAQVPPKKKSGGKVAVIAACVAAAAGLLVFGITKMTEKDPKEVVIAAFENIYTEDQAKPMEELFGLSLFQENAGSSIEGNCEIVLDDSSDESVKSAAGVGIRMTGESDQENKKISGNLGVLYNNMDLVNVNVYYGDETLMVSVPELSGKVFTLDLKEGVAERIQNSPLLGPALASSDVDIKELEEFFREYTQWIEKKVEDGAAGDPYGFKDVWKRYQEGCEAQKNFKAALTVEKAEKASFQMDGEEVSCKGYKVSVSKDAMLSFLRTSSDFFLQDPELKSNFLDNLRMSMRIMELTNSNMDMSFQGGKSAEEVLEENYEEAKEYVDRAMDELDKALSDMEMMVYVDKKGRLAAVQGTTSIKNDDDSTDVTFDLQLQGGSYLTQNALGKVELKNGTETMSFTLTKAGTYDGKRLTGDISLDCSGEGTDLNLFWGGTYEAEGGDFTLRGEAASDGEKVLGISAAGIVTELEKGTTIHMDLDEIRVEMPGDVLYGGSADTEFYLAFSGEYDLRPLSGAVEELSGDKLDVIEATETDWQRVIMEAYMGAMDIMNQMAPLLNGN